MHLLLQWVRRLLRWVEGLLPAPALIEGTPATQAPAPSLIQYDEAAHQRVHDGMQVFSRLVRTWMHNFGVEGAPQPDRAAALMSAFAGYPKEMAAYAREVGGLMHAVHDTIMRENLVDNSKVSLEDTYELAAQVALNMVQLGSTLAIPIEVLLESDIYGMMLPIPNPDNPEETIRPPIRRMPKAGMVMDKVRNPHPIAAPDLESIAKEIPR